MMDTIHTGRVQVVDGEYQWPCGTPTNGPSECQMCRRAYAERTILENRERFNQASSEEKAAMVRCIPASFFGLRSWDSVKKEREG